MKIKIKLPVVRSATKNPAADKRKLLDNAQALVHKGQYAAAADTYKTILKSDPDDVNVHNTLGDLYVRMNQKEEGLREHFWVADFFKKDGLFLRSIAICQKILKLDPEMLEARLMLADLYAQENLVAEARRQLFVIVQFYEKKGGVDEALEACSKAADLDPDNLKFRLDLGVRCEQQERPERAAREYARVAGALIRAGSADEACVLLDKAMEIAPGVVEPRQVKAEFLAAGEHWDEAADILAPVAAVEGASVQVITDFAGYCLKAGRVAEAVASLEARRTVEPSSSSVTMLLVRAYLAGKELEKAQAVCGPLIEELLAKRAFEAAERLARQYVEADPVNEGGLRQLLIVLQHKGDTEGAKSARTMLGKLLAPERKSAEVQAPVVKELQIGSDRTAAADAAGNLPDHGAAAVPAEEKLEELPVDAAVHAQQGLTDEAHRGSRGHVNQTPGGAEMAGIPGHVSGVDSDGQDRGAKELLIDLGLIEGYESEPGGVAGDGIPPQPEEGAVTSIGGDKGRYPDSLADRVGAIAQAVPKAVPAAAEAQSLSEFFQKHQKEIEGQLEEEDAEVHYNLGVAYKDMGLIEEALGEFRLSEGSQVRKLDSISKIASCLSDKGAAGAAVSKLESGLVLAAKGSAEEKGFLYDLGVVLSREGRHDEALEHFLKLYELDPDFRDVTGKTRKARR